MEMCRLAKLLTTDILIEILIRLPLDSVLACRRVCRSWNHLIGEPFFADLHRSFSPSPPTITLFYNPPDQDKLTTFGFITPAADGGNSSFSYDLNFTSKVTPYLNDLRIVGSCNGLFCLSSFDEKYYEQQYPDGFYDDYECVRLFLFNPALGTTSLMMLPDPPLPLNDYTNIENLGFGYIPSTGHYKIFKISHAKDQNHLSFHVCTIQRGGSSKAEKKKITASAWRIACDVACGGQSGPPQLTGFFSHPTFFKGSIVWIAETFREEIGGYQSLIYFDIEKEKMQSFLFPPAIVEVNKLIYLSSYKFIINIGVYYDDDGSDHLYLCEKDDACSYIWVIDNSKSFASLKPKWIINLPLSEAEHWPLRKLFRVHNIGRLLIGLKNSALWHYDPTTGAVQGLNHLAFPRCEFAIDIPNLLGCFL